MTRTRTNPFLTLAYEPALEQLSSGFWDPVSAAEFPQHILRFRNDDLLPLLGLDPAAVSDADFIEAFGQFQAPTPFLAWRYHGYQFGNYNPFLGDGRGFVYGQVRGTDGRLYDLGTKGSGRTPYSRGADGRLTLKGGVREVVAAEALHALGVRTSRCLSLIETGEQLWRHDEPSPTRASVMVRLNHSHIRFGTFECLHYNRQPDGIRQLLEHAIAYYYPHLAGDPERGARFYYELVQHVAELAAQWMAAGFCHGVLNTDNMSITGESFDYGPFAFIPTYNPQFTAASFDWFRRYSYGNQPAICRLNLELLQQPLAAAIPSTEMEASLAQFDARYWQAYRELMLGKLGLDSSNSGGDALLGQTLELLYATQVGYPAFFAELARGFSPSWRDRAELILENAFLPQLRQAPKLWAQWQAHYQQALAQLPAEAMDAVEARLQQRNPPTVPLHATIESVWQAISEGNDWAPFADLLARLQKRR